jgi:hypothetical protein
MSGKRIGMALAVGGAGMVAALALAGSASASTVTVPGQNVRPGQEVCAASVASTSFSVNGGAQTPGLKFRLFAQDGTVITATPGPVTSWSAYIYAGSPAWHGAGDYTACAKNNGTQTVFLNYLTVNAS